jgi:hypothetical protein
MECFHIHDFVANKMLCSVDGEGSKHHEGSKQGQREPLVLRFLFEETPPSASHELR